MSNNKKDIKIVGTHCAKKNILIKSLIDAINQLDLKNSEKNKKSFKNEWMNVLDWEEYLEFKIKNKTNLDEFFNHSENFGIWDKNYNLSKLAKNILDAKEISKEEQEISLKKYFDTFILNYVIEIGNKTYNPLICLLEYLENENNSKLFEINSETITKAMIGAATNWPVISSGKKIDNHLRLIFKQTNYFSEINLQKIKLKIIPQELLNKCNRKFHNQPIEKFKTDAKDQTERSTYFTTGFSVDRFDASKIQFSSKNNENQDFRQKIYYGAPGTGKSYKLDQDKKEIDPETTLRITFHPSYSYSNFVGIYKPKNENNKTVFNFIPGPLINILIKAYKESKKDHLLIIEEINRANVSEVFGDFFQLIERNREGKSQYDISVNEDLKIYLNQEKDKEENNKKLNNLNPDKLCFPSNLYIWATMNSSDQGTFPLDTAFKRRWEFEYIGIDDNDKEVKDIYFKLVGDEDEDKINWNKFRKFINAKLLEMHSTINEDKLLGPFFIGGNLNNDDLQGNAKIIKNKVIPYLYEDVLKFLGSKEIKKIFNEKLKTLSQIIKEFDKKNAKFTDVFSFSKKEIEDNENNSNSNNNATAESQDK